MPQTVGQQFTSVRYTAGLEANRSFTLRIVARDAAGNYSKYSNSVTFTTPLDLTPVLYAVPDTAAIIPLLQPETAYSFTVRARDFANNVSPPSDAAGDAREFRRQRLWRLRGRAGLGRDHRRRGSPWIIEYQIYVNGVYDHSLTLRYHRTIVYGTLHGLNEFSLVAVDTAGNRSAPATLTLSLDGCFP
jgi:hypothetical protein